MQDNLKGIDVAAKAANINDFDKDGGIFVPSSFSRIDADVLQEFDEVSDDERIGFILKRCFGIAFDDKELLLSDIPLVEIEEDLYVLELANANRFKAVDKELRPFVIAAELISVCVDLGFEETNLFLPSENNDFIKGATLAKDAGVNVNIFVGASEDREEDKFTYIAINNSDIKAMIKDFSDFDDYVFDPVSALGAGAFAIVEGENDAPSIIVSVANPLDYAIEVARALGVKAKDEDEAKRKLEELYALS